LAPYSEEVEDLILKDTNYTIIKNNDEFKGNKDPSRPTNRILTSFFTKSRLKFWLRYALVYVEETNKD
jgi:type I restriction enzyme R subunit